MNLTSQLTLGLGMLLLLPLQRPAAGPSADAVPQGQSLNHYIGAMKCRNCHAAKDSGDQFGHWQQAKHSKAFEELASEKAKAYAKERGVAEPQTDGKCLKCHVTAYERPKAELQKGFDAKLGVQCESCHGPGEKHFRSRMAAAATADPATGDRKTSYATIPDEEIVKKPDQKTCLGCHNEESPAFKPFCFHKAVNELRHLNPLKPRTAAERAALLVCGCGDKCACRNGCEDGKCGVPPPQDAAGRDGKK